MTTATAPKRALKVGEIKRHLDLLGYEDSEPVYLRFFYPEKNPKKADDKGIKAKHPKHGLDYRSIAHYQKDGRGCYLVVNGQGHKDKDVSVGRAIFYEHDDMRKEIQKDLWQHLGLPEPTFQVDTGGKSVHSYWVFSEPINVEQWKALQSDLLEHSDGDRKIKNPSRVMRLAGCYHTGSDCPSQIISSSGAKYSYSELRAAIPENEVQVSGSNWTEFDKQFTLPTTSTIPLVECLSRKDRDVLARGTGEGGRNSDGFALAKDLLGTADVLRGLGQPFDGDPKQLFEDYCNNCTPPIDQAERDAIWKSAGSDNSGPSLSPDQIENCIKGWSWRQHKISHPEAAPNKTKTLSESQKSIVSQENGYAELRLAVSGALALEDPDEQLFELHNIKDRFRKPLGLIQRLVKNLTKITDTTKHSYNLDDVETMDMAGVPFLVPRFVPEVGLTCLGGYAKDGKSTFMYEIIAALIKGEPLLGFKPLKKCKVLLIQTEEPLPTIYDNLDGKGLLYNADIDKESLRIEKQWSIEDTATLERWIEEYGPDLICFDSFRMLNKDTGISENSPEAANAVYGIQAILHRHKIAGLLIHHTTKNKEASGIQRLGGSSSIPGACDNIMMLSRVGTDPEDPKRQLYMTGRNIKGRFIVQWNTDEYPSFNWEVVSESGIDAEAKNMQARVLDVIRKNQRHRPDGMSAGFIKQVLELPKENKSVYKAIKLLVDTGDLAMTRELGGGGRRARIYSLPKHVRSNEETLETFTQQEIEKVSNPPKVGIQAVSRQYPDGIHVPETHTTDTTWKRDGEVDSGSPIVSDKGGQTHWRTNHAPYMQKRNPSLLEQYEKDVLSTGLDTKKEGLDTKNTPHGYQVDTNLDTTSDADAARVVDGNSGASIQQDTRIICAQPIEVGAEVEYTYHDCGEDERNYIVANNEHPPKGTKGVVMQVYWEEIKSLGGAWMLDILCGDDLYKASGLDYVTPLPEGATSHGS